MAGPLQEEKFYQGNIIFFFSFLIGIAITEATQCLVCSKTSVDLRTGRLSSQCLGCLIIQGHPMSIFGKYLFGGRFEI